MSHRRKSASPFSYSPIARRISASSELFLRVTQRYEKPAWNIDSTIVAGRQVAVEIVTELDKPFCRLIHFRRAIEGPQGRNYRPGDPRILLVAPLSGHHATLLRDTVRSLLPEHDVWVTDWVDARMVPLSAGPFHLADYVDYVREFITLLTDPRHPNVDYFNHLLAGDDGSAEKHREFYDEYNAVLDLPAEYYLDTVKAVFQDFALPKGRLFMREQLVRPQAIRATALLSIEGELDDISGNGQTEAAHLLCFNIPAAAGARPSTRRCATS